MTFPDGAMTLLLAVVATLLWAVTLVRRRHALMYGWPVSATLRGAMVVTLLGVGASLIATSTAVLMGGRGDLVSLLAALTRSVYLVGSIVGLVATFTEDD